MLLHFGQTTAEKDGLFMDMKRMKREYKGYEHWNPHRRIYDDYEKGFSEEKVNQVSSMLLNKTKNATPKFQMW